jgi:epoxyqueuosine reductase
VTEQSTQPAADVLEMCEREGFALAGAARLVPTAYAHELREWLTAGKHGEMAWLADRVEERLDPKRLLPGATSVVMVADYYSQRGAADEEQGAGVGRIARYARGRDYHDVLKRRVRRVCDGVRERYPDCETRAFCDTAPVLERELAALCGLGWVGKHTLLIHPDHGSWMVLGGFLTTLELGSPVAAAREPDHCGSCTRCIDACPTSAITPYSVDARRCISYLTLERKPSEDGQSVAAGALDLGDWLVGCDVCQEVCPHNSPRSAGREGLVRDEYSPRRSGFELLDVLGWDEATRRARFATSAMKRVSLARMKMNAIVLAGSYLRDHSTDLGEAVRARLEGIAWDAGEPASVRVAARDTLKMPDPT